jgi:hypothetical protein
MLCGVGRQLINDVSRQDIGPIFRSQAVHPTNRNIQEERMLKLHRGRVLSHRNMFMKLPCIIFIENPFGHFEFLHVEGRTDGGTDSEANRRILAVSVYEGPRSFPQN